MLLCPSMVTTAVKALMWLLLLALGHSVLLGLHPQNLALYMCMYFAAFLSLAEIRDNSQSSTSLH